MNGLRYRGWVEGTVPSWEGSARGFLAPCTLVMSQNEKLLLSTWLHTGTLVAQEERSRHVVISRGAPLLRTVHAA